MSGEDDDKEIVRLPVRTVWVPKSDPSEDEIIATAECPDCASSVTVFGPDETGKYDALVRHDETCPTFEARRRASGEEP